MSEFAEHSFSQTLELGRSAAGIVKIPEIGGLPRELNSLYRPCKPVELTPEGLSRAALVAIDLSNAMATFHNVTGVRGGLYANQKGHDLEVMVRRYLVDGQALTDTYYNLKITPLSDKKIKFREGCLSMVPRSVEVVRYAEILAEFYDQNGKFHQEEHKENFLAVILQHEYDHSRGITCDHCEGTDSTSIRDLTSFDDWRSQKIVPA